MQYSNRSRLVKKEGMVSTETFCATDNDEASNKYIVAAPPSLSVEPLMTSTQRDVSDTFSYGERNRKISPSPPCS